MRNEELSGETEEDEEEPVPKKRLRLSDYSKELEKRHADLSPYRDSTIQKWNDKTRLASGTVNSKTFSGFESSTMKQIEHILSDKGRLIRRTQVMRSNYSVLGKRAASDAEMGDNKGDAQVRNS